MADVTKEEEAVVKAPVVDAKAAKVKAKVGPGIKDTSGTEVPAEDYFFGGFVPNGFEKSCGKPVDREDLVEVFDKVFNPSDKYLFYKSFDKEVYIIIIPIKFATTVGVENGSVNGDFQKHAISFISEGSVNLETLTIKLKKIKQFCKNSDR